MALFKIMYFVWLFIVCNLIKLSRSDNDIKVFIKWAQRIDQGPYSGPFQLESVSYDTLKEYEERFYKDLYCNYVISATVHMYVIEKILVNWYGEIEANWVDDRIKFTKQAKQMLYVAFNSDSNESRQDTVEIMWIIHMFVEMVETIFFPPHIRKINKQRVLKTHKVVVTILEEYIGSHTCHVYDPNTNNRVNDVKSVVDTKTYNAINLESLTKLVVDGKDRLNKQNEHNYGLDDRLDYGYDKWSNVSLYQLLFHWWPENEPCYVESLHYFGIQLDLTPIKNQLKGHSTFARDLNNIMYMRIAEIISYQEQFVLLMKAIAVRLTLRYLENINRLSLVLTDVVNYNEKMLEHFNRFAQHFNISNDDKYIRPVIDLLSGSAQTFVNRCVINGHANTILNILEKMSSDDMRFDIRMKVNETDSIQTIANIRSLVSQHTCVLSALEGTIESSAIESLVVVEAFVTFATGYTPNIDFKLMESFAQLGTSESYRRLRKLEYNQEGLSHFYSY